MDRPPNGKLLWDIQEIARALKIQPEDVREYFTDGRRVSFVIERRLCREVLGGSLASQGDAFDLVDRQGRKWEVRSISQGGIYFCPSYMVGSGRTFDERGFLTKLDEIVGYIVADIESFPEVPFWVVEAAEVRRWWANGKLGTTTKISRQRALELVRSKERRKAGTKKVAR